LSLSDNPSKPCLLDSDISFLFRLGRLPDHQSLTKKRKMRKFIVGGNWKMNGDKSLLKEISTALNSCPWTENTEVVIAPPAPLLPLAREQFAKSIGIAAQNCSQGN
jgi:hypothetical protein